VRLRGLLQDLGLKSFPLLSGGKGIHVVVPLDQSRDWPTVKSFADRFDVAGFVRNITNDESAVSGIDFNNLTAMVNEPRIWGVEVGVKF
jgi:hypothetical protein